MLKEERLKVEKLKKLRNIAVRKMVRFRYFDDEVILKEA
jgi:hypothetical protein